MPSRRLLAAVAVAALGVSAAIACGPMFPIQLLTDRAETLAAAPVNSFAFEVTRLVTPTDDLTAKETASSWYPDPDEEVKKRSAAEIDGLSPAQATAIARMRRSDGGDAAFRAGAVLPAAIRLYTAGAVAYAKDDLEQAAARFDAVLRLPAPDQQARATWAAFMLGKVRALDGDVDGAAQAFALTRALARGGAPDPLGLAVASWGEEARLHLPDEDAPLSDPAVFAQSIGRAVALYAEQAARGSSGGVQSLRMVAEMLMRAPERMTAAIAEPQVQRLLVVYVLARVQDVEMALSEFKDFQVDEIDRTTRKRPPDALARLMDAIERRGLDAPVDADRLAALAYYTGRYDAAARLVARADGALAAWIGAKLAVQRGDLAAATDLYATAARAFPAATDEGPLDTDNRRLLVGERGVLALARGDYMSALDHLYRARYWGDVAHIAERVLTVDEFKGFVDQAPALPTVRRDDDGYWGSDEAPGNITARLHDVLARRLMRARRFDAAIAYFKDAESRDRAIAYAAAYRAATQRWDGIERARHWYAAATLARHAGMRIMGYEAGPDYAVRGGAFEGGLGQTELGDGPLVGADERARFAATTPLPPRRYHYRYLAVDEILQAAELLPPRSQAFAAVLCHATGWMRSSNADDIVQALYRLYVTQGPAVPWAKNFGRDCPEPDFDAAARLRWSQPWAAARHAARRNLAWLAPVLVIGALGVACLIARRRRLI